MDGNGTTATQLHQRRQPRPACDLDDVVERAERAEERLRLQTLLFAEAEHKLKTSVAVISGWASTLDDRWETLSPQQRRDGVATIRRSADTLAMHTRSLLEGARTEMARLDLEPIALDLASILRVTTRTFSGLSTSHHIRCTVDGPVWVLADPAGLQQVLGHLIENAVKYSPGGGTVRLHARANRRWAELLVTDEGVGVPDDVDVFAAFTRGSITGTGVGLGLYIVKNLVEGMGGTVTAVRNPLRGSTFTVLLPTAGR
ncbi:MAG TPA: HAMP domain-containing sensor histidine kinase [Acidimicrobiales bacterium]|nr:HAMP domain-containing sensor histidine kinase [Acidimicrobiales bacterium]